MGVLVLVLGVVGVVEYMIFYIIQVLIQYHRPQKVIIILIGLHHGLLVMVGGVITTTGMVTVITIIMPIIMIIMIIGGMTPMIMEKNMILILSVQDSIAGVGIGGTDIVGCGPRKQNIDKECWKKMFGNMILQETHNMD